jgi:hypothetical protein
MGQQVEITPRAILYEALDCFSTSALYVPL